MGKSKHEKQAQRDQILIRKKWANSLRKCRAYSSVEIDSDYRIVTAKIKSAKEHQENNQNALFRTFLLFKLRRITTAILS